MRLSAVAHGAPVLHREAHFAEHAIERGDEIGAGRGVADRIDMNMDEALARGGNRVGCADGSQLAAIAPHAEHRMRDQPHIEPAFGEFAHHRVDQERHVVVDDLDHRDRLALARGGERHDLAADLRCARRTLAQKIVGPPGKRGEIVGAIAQHVLGNGAGVKLRDECGWDVVAAAAKRATGLLDDGAGCAFFIVAGTLYGHGISHF